MSIVATTGVDAVFAGVDGALVGQHRVLDQIPALNDGLQRLAGSEKGAARQNFNVYRHDLLGIQRLCALLPTAREQGSTTEHQGEQAATTAVLKGGMLHGVYQIGEV